MSYTSLSKYILALVVVVFLASCGGGGENKGEGQVTDLRVLTATPASFAQAPRSGPISVTFTDAIDAASVTTSSFQVTSSEGPLAGVISVQGATITFTPTQPLAIGVRYTATVTADIRSVAGHRLSAATTWQFDRGHKMAAGGAHICAILPDLRVKCWGKNFAGQLGLGDVLARGDIIRMGAALPAVDLDSGHKAVELAAGSEHTCALLDNGQIKCWGANYGQLVLGDAKNRGAAAGEMGDALPAVDLGAGRTAKQIVAGGSYTCALLDNGLVICWGWNDAAQLGLGDAHARGDEPGEMGDALPAVQLGSGRAAIAIAAGWSYTCALLDNGLIKCWGWNGLGQLGLGDTSMRGSATNQMGDLLASVDLGVGRVAVDVAAGGFHSCALLDNGQLKCWGDNSAGQLGLGDTVNRGDQSDQMGDALPSVDLGTGRRAQHIALGFAHTCALLDNGQVKCWGDNDSGQLGLEDAVSRRGIAPGQMGDNLPGVDLGTGQRALEIALNDSNTCAILNTGHIKCWGRRIGGLLGLGDDIIGNSPGELGDGLAALNLGTGRTGTAIAVGDYHACALLDTGQVKCWGDGYSGQLGLGDTRRRGYSEKDMGDALPAVQLGTGHTAISIAAGYNHTCALLDNGKLKCWGDNSAGQLGLGDTVNRGDQSDQMGDALPSVDLGTGCSAQLIALSFALTCALLDNGQVKCWGGNDSGQLGLEDTISRGITPGQMGDALPVINLGAGRTALQVAAGFFHTCALLDTHQVKCWGANSFGQLGDTATRGDEPGEDGRCAAQRRCRFAQCDKHKRWCGSNVCHPRGGELKCWGNNADAQLGLGDNTTRGITPSQMADNLPVIDFGTERIVMEVASLFSSACALLDNGQVKCWGNGGYTLGLGVPANMTGVGDNPGEMGDARPVMNLAAPPSGSANETKAAAG